MKIFLWSSRLSSILKPATFCWSCLVFISIKKMSTVPSLALEALEIISIRNQKELKLLACRLKIYIVVLLDKMLRKLTVIFFNFIFFWKKKYRVTLHLGVTFQIYQIYLVWQTLWKVTKVSEKCSISSKSYFSNVKMVLGKSPLVHSPPVNSPRSNFS